MRSLPLESYLTKKTVRIIEMLRLNCFLPKLTEIFLEESSSVVQKYYEVQYNEHCSGISIFVCGLIF